MYQGKRVVLVTGAAGGIGLATAKKFIDNGWFVIGTDQYTLKADGPFHVFVPADLTDPQGRAYLTQVVRKVWARVDIDCLILNHGVGANLDHQEGRPIVCHTVEDWNSEDFARVMQINFETAVQCVQMFVPLMPECDASSIISASSIWSRGVLHYALPYAASKAALSVATQNWARQFAPIRAVDIVLGGFDTPMLNTNPNGKAEVSEQTLLKRAGKPEEVAETYWYVANCNYLTASSIVLDGGSKNR